MTLKNVFVSLLVTLLYAVPAAARPRPILIGLDAEFGHSTSTSAEAIKRGASIAIDEINHAGGVLRGRPLALEIRDNRSVPNRAIENVQDLAANPDVIAVLTGKFSPAVKEIVPVAHKAGLPVLASWSAADDIVDNGLTPNHVFRLSLRDDWALEVMLKHAARLGARRVGLMVPNTSWGRSSVAATERRVKGLPNLSIAGVSWYNWGEKSLLPGYQQLRLSGAEALLLVANETEGAVLVNELARLPIAERLPIVSHWGVTGGRFFSLAAPALSAVDFSVVQTYSFIDAKDAVAQRVLAGLKRHYGIDDPRQIEAPVGVAHAYDLVHLLARAIELAGSADRGKVRSALEKVRNYQGLVRHYREPFTATRHEALDASIVFVATYDREGALIRVGKK